LIKDLFHTSSARVNGRKTKTLQIIPHPKVKNPKKVKAPKKDITITQAQNINNTITQEDITQYMAQDINNTITQEDITQNIAQDINNTISPITEDEEMEKHLKLFEENLRNLNKLKKYSTVDLFEKYDEEICVNVLNHDEHFNKSEYIGLRQKRFEMYEILNYMNHGMPLPDGSPKLHKEPKKYISKKAAKEYFNHEDLKIANELYELSPEEYNKRIEKHCFEQTIKDLKYNYNYKGINIIPLIKAINIDKVYDFPEVCDLFKTTLKEESNLFNEEIDLFNEEINRDIIIILSREYFDCNYRSYLIKDNIINDKLMIGKYP
jgi:hypothetical protein